MSQVDHFLVALKEALKEKKIKYRDLAKSLNLSESSIKRLLTSKSISLQRIEDICRTADVKFSELVKSVEDLYQDQFLLFSEKQEQTLSENLRLLHFYMMLCDGANPRQIEIDYQISHAEVQKFLFQLDKLGLLELHLHDKVKIKMNAHLRFRREGPIGRILFSQARATYLNHDFSSEDYIRLFTLRVSSSALVKYKVKMDNILMELQETAEFEARHDIHGEEVGVLFAFRPWQYSFMDALKLKPSHLGVGSSMRIESA
jgi:DNA-binding Xre family transcriptional regulator